MELVIAGLIELVERGLLPDVLVRWGVRMLLRQRLQELPLGDCEATSDEVRHFVAMMDAAEVAPEARKANVQHYEVPAPFFEHILGPRRKYSCCYFGAETDTLAEAEAAALSLTCQRAELYDGARILELGCGWGALSLWMAEHYPQAEILAVSNSHSQREYIAARAHELGLANIEARTSDMNHFNTDERFDRVVSVEMFEHMRNYRALFERIHGWLRPGGRFFLHIFCHRAAPYAFEVRDAGDWMGQHFFSGGIMPSADLPLFFQDRLRLIDQWRWSGRHYALTLNAWLARMDAAREHLRPIVASTYGKEHTDRWWQRWRIFFMACAELFAYRRGQEWFVSHYLFEKAGH
jgi:cyclopropane-fatty-acyl-phospholipid synthase